MPPSVIFLTGHQAQKQVLAHYHWVSPPESSVWPRQGALLGRGVGHWVPMAIILLRTGPRPREQGSCQDGQLCLR